MDIAKRTAATRQASTGWYIQRLAGRLDAMMTEALKEHGLTLPQFPVLMTALECGGLTQSDYAARYRMPAYAISRAIDALVAQGLIERRPDPNSRRAHNIHPTDAALRLAPKLFAIIERVNAEMTEPLGDDEKKVLRSLLAKTLNAT